MDSIEEAASVRTVATDKWVALRQRLASRVVTTIDVISILLLDAVILGAGYLIVWATKYLSADLLPADAIRFFATARLLSVGLFLILYVVVVAFHLYRFCRDELGAGSEK